ncbi:MAG: MBL fold metallo-hydrolase [Saprospiraceae bacterium]|nr:MBL fold metallo-hydrolase [Saprospiraceae bacterium]
MMLIKTFTFNDFYENTYLVYDNSKECAIIDPGCNTKTERDELINFIEDHKLKPVLLLNTHCHIDHILGNLYISSKYNVPLVSHKGEQTVLDSGKHVSMMYNIPYDVSPDISVFYKDGDEITFGLTTLKVLFTPGHSPASICFYEENSKKLIAGDVLFEGSIGRTDLPGGDYETLINSIKNKLFVLPDDVKVFPGHGNSTTIGHEKRTNPFFND